MWAWLLLYRLSLRQMAWWPRASMNKCSWIKDQVQMVVLRTLCSLDVLNALLFIPNNDFMFFFLFYLKCAEKVLKGTNFFLGQLGKSSDDESRPRWKRGRGTVSDFYWLNIPPAPASALGARSTVSRLNGSRIPSRYQAPHLLLTPA